MDKIIEDLKKIKNLNTDEYLKSLKILQKHCDDEIKNINTINKTKQIIKKLKDSKFVTSNEIKNMCDDVTIIMSEHEQADYHTFTNTIIKIANIQFIRQYEGDNEGDGTYYCKIINTDDDVHVLLFENGNYFDDLKNLSYADDNYGKNLLKFYKKMKFNNTTKKQFSIFIQFVITDLMDKI